MKRFGFLFSVMVIMMAIVFNCCKKEDNSVPAERKEYAWVAGCEDSTGYGLILFSADGGENWVRQAAGLPSLLGIKVLDIWAVDEKTVWAVGSGNVILKTLDGGITWMQVQSPANNPDTELNSICIVNHNNIWISGTNGSVYNSADNGNTWTMFDPAFFHNAFMQGIWAITPQKVYAVGAVIGNSLERGFITSTSDGGATWDSITPSDDYNRHQWIGVTASGNTIVVYGVNSHYIASTDGGTTWKNDSLQTPGGGGGADINHMVIVNPQTWWGALDLGQFYLTNDGGSAWMRQLTDQGIAFMFGIDAWNSQIALAVTRSTRVPLNGSIMKTLNWGTTWEVKKSYNTRLSKVTYIKK